MNCMKILSILCLLVLLSACGGGADTVVEETPTPPPVNEPTSNYNGPAAATTDIQDFRLNVWDNIATNDTCGACHVQSEQAPFFARNDDINEAYAIVNTLVDRDNVANSRLVTKVAGGHNCWLSSNQACGDIMTSWLSAWLDNNESATVYPLLELYCSECHTSNAAIPISPFMGSSDVIEAYFASISKLNLDQPADSRRCD